MTHSKSSLFLMELIIAILFFSLSSAVCIRLFARAHIISEETVNQNNAITQAQNLAEVWRASEGNLNQMKELLPHSLLIDDGNSISLSYDKTWNLLYPADERGTPAFYAQLFTYPAEENRLITAEILIFQADAAYPVSSETALYSLVLTHHIAERRGSLE